MQLAIEALNTTSNLANGRRNLQMEGVDYIEWDIIQPTSAMDLTSLVWFINDNTVEDILALDIFFYELVDQIKNYPKLCLLLGLCSHGNFFFFLLSSQ